jgi:hypothetical protein
MRVNISKSKFFAEQIEYLSSGYWITIQGIQTIRYKVKMNTILNIKAPKTKKKKNKLRQCIGMVNYYRDLWLHRRKHLDRIHCLVSY